MLAALKPGFSPHCGLLCRDVRWNLLPPCLGLKNWVDFDTGAFRVMMWLSNIRAFARLFSWSLALLTHFYPYLEALFLAFLYFMFAVPTVLYQAYSN